MSIWLTGWTGDNAASLVVGRKRNTLLIGFSSSDHGIPQLSDWDQPTYETNGIKYYDSVWVSCLTPGARDAVVTGIEQTAFSFAFRVTQVERDDGKNPWEPGVHVFTVTLSEAVSPNWCTTLATAVIPSKIDLLLDLTDASVAVDWYEAMDSARRRAEGKFRSLAS
jgi:hypothetical protein